MFKKTHFQSWKLHFVSFQYTVNTKNPIKKEETIVLPLKSKVKKTLVGGKTEIEDT